MIDLPWSSGGDTDGPDEGDADDGADSMGDHADAIVVCAFQDGTLAVYDDRAVIERVERS